VEIVNDEEGTYLDLRLNEQFNFVVQPWIDSSTGNWIFTKSIFEFIFHIDEQSHLNSISINLEPSLDPIVFERQ